MGDVMEFDMGSGGGRRRPPPRIASRLEAGRRGSGAKSTDGPIQARPPSGRADAKASDSIPTRRPSVSSRDSFNELGRDSFRRGRVSSDDEAAPKPMVRKGLGSPPGKERIGMERRGSFDARASGVNTNTFRLGQKVEGRFRGKGRWYKGRIIGVKGGDRYDVRYEDNDEDLGLDASAIRAEDAGNSGGGMRVVDRPAGAGPRQSLTPRIGDRVEARVPGSTRWQRATVVEENRNGTVDVRLRDGTKERQLEPDMVRALEDDDGLGGRGGVSKSASDTGLAAAGRPSDETYRPGDKVEARFGGKSQWYKGTVERENRDGTFYILYADGDEEKAVKKSLMRKVGSAVSLSGSKSPGRRVISGGSSEGDLLLHFRKGDKVEARYKRGRQWFAGTIRGLDEDGRYSILYDDGDTEDGVDPGLVRNVGAGSTDSLVRASGAKSRREPAFLEGDKVEARLGGHSRWFKAVVERKNRDGTYYLVYANGEEERAVRKDLIRKADGAEGDGVRHQSVRRVGEEVEARYKRGVKWYPGVIRRVNSDGTMDIRYKDGDAETDVDPSLVRGKGGASMESLDSRSAGEKVPTTPRSRSPAAAGGRRPSFDDLDPNPRRRMGAEYAEGDRVEARLGGRSHWLRAMVERKNRDGSYWLIYADGDEERSVGSDLIRRIDEGGSGGREQPSSRSPGRKVVSGLGTDSEVEPVGRTRLREGDDVEARYKRGRKWYRGKIRRLNADGTYDIKYADGDSERNVESQFVRALGAASDASLTTSNTASNDGRSGLERRGSSRDVDDSASGRFDAKSSLAGESKEGSCGKEIDGVSIASFSRGDAVEARYRGRGTKFFKGKVTRVNSDGTLDIAYDDGDKEIGIAREHVSSLEPKSSEGSGKGGDVAKGDRVEARYRGRGTKFYKGKVARVNSDATVDIAYDDGDKEFGLALEHVKSLEPPKTVGGRAPDMARGDLVEARYRGKGTKFYKGKISRVNSDGTLDIAYDDGDKEIGIAAKHVRSLEPPKLGGGREGKGTRMAKGDRVEARYRGKGHKFYKGTVSRVNSDGTLDIAYDDGDKEIGIALEHVNPSGLIATGGGDKRIGAKVTKGDRVEARYRGRGTKFYKGTISRVNSDLTLDIAYDDGEKEFGISEEHVRSLEPQGNAGVRGQQDKTAALLEGDKVEADYRSRGRFLPGRISRAHRDGTYDIEYDDGERERMVDPSLVKALANGRAERAGSGRLEVGMKVEARYRGGSRYFPGRISRVHRDGTCDVNYDDGEAERLVHPSLIKPVAGGGTEPAGVGGPLEEGMRVEARYRGRSRYFPGKIARVHRDGSCDIDYDDGEQERMVDPSLIKAFETKSTEMLLEVGSKVEARYKGSSRYYPGIVIGVHRDGSCDIDYDDGERERGVASHLIRMLDSRGRLVTSSAGATAGADGRRPHDEGEHPPGRRVHGRVDSTGSLSTSAGGGSSYNIGDKVEARLGGRSRWYKATVERVNRDGTYYLLYARGDSERAVDSSLIRGPASDAAMEGEGKRDEKFVPGEAAAVAHRVGDEVEARYKGGRRWYPGKIRAVNLDGSYDVQYKDGDSERDVQASFVRRVGSVGTATEEDSPPAGLAVGDKVEGRFGGGSRWFKATVERKNRDGTFCLLYADGDMENAVEREFIRKPGAGIGGVKRPDNGDHGARGTARRVLSRAGSETGTDVDVGEVKDGRGGGGGVRETRGLGKANDPPRAGDQVEARFRGGSKWVPGVVTRAHRDGSCDVEYKDGKTERAVRASYVRLALRGSSDSDSDRRAGSRANSGKPSRAVVAIVKGDRVEARLHGRSTWHKGEVTRVHSDGTYDVRNSRDGELESRVDPRLVRLPQGTAPPVRGEGGARVRSSGGRSAVNSSSESEPSGGRVARSRSQERGVVPEEPASGNAEAAATAATKVRRALRNAGKTAEDFARKLERVRRASGGVERRGRSVVGGIDKRALEKVLAGVGVELSPDEARALRRRCPDAENDGCVDPSVLVSFVTAKSCSPVRHPSSRSRVRGDGLSDVSASESGVDAARPRRVRSNRRSRRRGDSSSSLASATTSSGYDRRRRHRRRHHSSRRSSGEKRTPGAGSQSASSSGGGRRMKRRPTGGGGGGTSDSENGDGGGTSSEKRAGTGVLIGGAGLRALKKLEGPALDGSLRREFNKIGGGRRRELSTSDVNLLLRRFRVKLEESPLAELMSLLDPEHAGSISLDGILEAALSTTEEKKIARIHGAICDQIFKPSSRRAKRKESEEAKAAVAAASKALTKLEHQKASGLLVSRDLKNLLYKAGARVSSEDAEALAERLDPLDLGKIDREAFVVWLTSGIDAAQAESRALGQLRLLKATKARNVEKAFEEFDPDGDGEVSKADFVLALNKLGLVLTHGQAATLAAKYHGNYMQFVTTLGDPRRFSPEEGAASDSEDSAAEGAKGGKNWIKRLGRRRRGSSAGPSTCKSRSRRRGSGGDGGSSNDSGVGPLTSGSSDEGGEDGKGDDGDCGLLLGRGARVALRDAFQRACTTTGGVKEVFSSAAGNLRGKDERSRGQDIVLSSREQARRFLRRLKLDASDEDRAALLDAVAGPPSSSSSSDDGGVRFEGDSGRGRKKRTKGGDDGGKSDDDGVGVRISYRDFLELVLAEQESKEISRIHGRMSKDLVRAADRSSARGKPACPFDLVVKALSKYDSEGLGYIKASAFKRSLEKIGFGGLNSVEKSLLVRRFDPVEEGMINCEVFSAWLSSGLDPDRLLAKLGRLLGQLTGRNSRCGDGGSDGGGGGGKGAKERAKAIKRLLKGGVRGFFEAVDEEATGTVSRHDMKVVLRRTLGLPLTEGDLRALFHRLDKDGTGMLDYEELLALASKKDRSRRVKQSGSGILSKLKERGSALVAGGKGSKRGGRGGDSSDGGGGSGETNASGEEEDGDDEGGGKGDGKKTRKKEEKKRPAKEGKKENKAKKGRKKSEDGEAGRSTHRGWRGPRLEIKLMKLRMSILQQSAAAAAKAKAATPAASVAGDKENGGSGDDEKQQEEARGSKSGGSASDGSSSPAAIAEKWTALFESRDRAGTGRATAEDLQAVLKEGGVKISGDDKSLLVFKFAARSHGDGNHEGDGEWEGKSGTDEKAAGGEGASSSSSSSGAIDYDAFVRWLSEGGGLDDALLGKVQRHLKARLSKAMDLRALFTEMCGGPSKHRGGGGGKHAMETQTLSSTRLARGLKHAGLPLDRAVVNLLVSAFSTSGAGGSGGGGKHHHHHPALSYADFHRMVHADELPAGGYAGDGGGEATLDEQVRSALLETVERAFAFYDEDNSNSIDATEVGNILRALGHDLTRGEARALLRKANVDRNGEVQFESFQEAVMPFLLERARSKKVTEGELHAMFDEIDTNRTGAIKREEFTFLFCGKLRLLMQHEAEALLGILDRHHSGQVVWVEFVKLFELVDDQTGDGGIAALTPELKEVVAVALRKLRMGAMPDVEGQLSSFLGMPSTCRKSVLAPLDHIKELSLQWVLMPKLDSRGCIQLQDMSVKVTTEVAEVEANKAPLDEKDQILVKTSNLADRVRGSGKTNKMSTAKSLAATLGFGRRDKDQSPPPAITESKGTKTRRRSAILGAGLMETTTTVRKRATLQEVGASTEEGAKRGRGGVGGDGPGGGGDVMQVELSVKHAYGIPVARDSKMGDIRQRGMRACLFYDTGKEVDKNTGEASSEYGEHFLCNTYKTLAIQHPQKEEQWLFPDSSEGERKFLVRTDFGSGGDSRQGRNRRKISRNHQEAGDEDTPTPSSSCRGDAKKLFLLVELTCTVQTAKHGLAGGKRGGHDAVKGPLKNFRGRTMSRRRVGGVRRRRGGDDDSDSSFSGESGSAADYSADSRGEREGEQMETASATSSESGGGSGQHAGSRGRARGKKSGERNAKRGNRRRRRRRPGIGDDDDDDNEDSSASADSDGNSRSDNRNKKQRSGGLFNRNGGNSGKPRERKGRADPNRGGARHPGRGSKSAPPHRSSRRPQARRGSGSRRGARSEGEGIGRRRRHRRRGRRSCSSGSESEDGSGSRSVGSDASSASSRSRDGRRGRGQRKKQGGGGWKQGWRGGSSGRSKGQARGTMGGGGRRGDERDGLVEVEMSCGWVLIPFLELVEVQEVKRVRYKLLGGTPFAKADINEDEVMTRRYGWRAVLKAMKIEGTHKGSEVEIKILPVNSLSKLKQEDIFRLPRNVILSDTFVSLVRHYREYAANSLAKRSARGMGNVGFGAGSASSEPVLALFPRLAADPALMMALKNQWEVEVRKTHVDGRLGTTISSKLVGLGMSGGGAGGLAGATGAAREACFLAAFEKAVMRLWPAFCHIDAQRARISAGQAGAESYEELESRGQRIREILESTDSFHSDTPMNAQHRGEGGGWRGSGGGAFSSATSQEGRVMVAFTVREVSFDVA